jgi:hypothetical protein
MIGTHPCILYMLPKSRTTQAFLDRNKIEKIWKNIDSFLNTCTTTSINQPESITLTAYSAVKGDNNPEIATRIQLDAQSAFGKGETFKMGRDFPTETIWKLSNLELSKAIDYIQKGQPWPKFAFGPIELLINYDFKLVDLTTKTELPYQENTSNLMIWLSKSCCCAPNFWLPFAEPNEKFSSYLRSIEPFLPFKFEPKYFKLGRPNKGGTAYVFKKLSNVKDYQLTK